MSCLLRRYVTYEEQTTKFYCFHSDFFFFLKRFKSIFDNTLFLCNCQCKQFFPALWSFSFFLPIILTLLNSPFPKKIKSIQQVFTVLRARLLSVVMVTIIWLPTLIHALDVKEKKETSFCFFWSCHEMWFRWYIFVKKINKNPDDKN